MGLFAPGRLFCWGALKERMRAAMAAGLPWRISPGMPRCRSQERISIDAASELLWPLASAAGADVDERWGGGFAGQAGE